MTAYFDLERARCHIAHLPPHVPVDHGEFATANRLSTLQRVNRAILEMGSYIADAHLSGAKTVLFHRKKCFTATASGAVGPATKLKCGSQNKDVLENATLVLLLQPHPEPL